MLTSTTALVLATAAAAAITMSPSVSAQGPLTPYVMLSEHTYFEGRQIIVYPGVGTCHNMYGDNDRIASSARWFNFPRGQGTRIYFFDTNGCQGESRSWSIDEPNFPNNFVIDGFNDRISSLRIEPM